MRKLFSHSSGFTLIEMVITVTIFAVMSIAVVSIYIQTTNLAQKLRMTRHLSETAREITERIADDVREKWMTGVIISASTNPYWNWSSSYSSSGSEILGIWDGNKAYIYGKKSETGIDPCDTVNQNDPKIHCGLYVLEWTDYANAFNLVDSFIPEEEKKRVKIENLNFYISGDGNTTEKKVTLVFTLVLMPRIGIPAWLIADTRLHIETTISERFFRE